MEQLLNYFPTLSDEQHKQFQKMYSLYVEWNQQINVISRKDMDGFYVRHVLHALALAKFISFVPGTQILDVGTGGGFPGVPLAVFFPKVHFHLVDSIGKKIKVVNAVVQALSIKNVTTSNKRMEAVTNQVDFIVCRAVAPMDTLVHWIGDKLKPDSQNKVSNGLICLKGGDLSEELRPFPKAKVISLQQYFSEPFFETKKLVYLPKF
ncbi:MAG: Ribosomal RNA small subunit methyltransferase G [Flavobacteriaceae bacterium]|nr:MAG: Ribosomal RNA small subunit methyltransferase G [Flavobacteriaceae bacterium]